ncbi:MAG: glycosyltransferase, partial [Nitrospinota bacterium]|nr:glycosyltransferase [Nitrospinota bacterium]
MEKNPPFKELELPRKILVATFIVVALWYLTWRWSTFNPEARVFSYALYGAELFGFCTMLMHLFMTWRLTVRQPPPAPEGLSVDVFVTTINEPVGLLRRTLVNAINMNYPHQTWLLDDGRRPEMEALAQELGCHYLIRPDNTDAKAGNLNHALQQSNADFVAVFDADHSPGENFLDRTLGYFNEESLAFVQTPQDFYNLDSFQHHRQTDRAQAWHEQSVFFSVIQRGKDYWNAAFFCGSCAVIRRSALDAIGGFATGTVTEDLHTSVRFHKQGFTSVYHDESLAFGLAPSNMVSFLKQRVRWGQGAMQAWRQEGVFFCRNLTLAQRINYLASSITYFDGWQKLFYYTAPVIVLTTGVMPIQAVGSEFLLHFLPYIILSFWMFEEVNRGYGRSVIIEQFNMARFASLAWSTLGFFKKHLRFHVTDKVVSPEKETAWYLVPQTIVLVLNLSALLVGIALYYYDRHLTLEGLLVCGIWALVNLALAASVLLFSKGRARFKRADYRFPIPLPAHLTLKDASALEVYGVVDNISAGGFRFYAPVPKSVREGQTLEGEIFLPAGPLRVQAEIKSLMQGSSEEDVSIAALGCRFEGDSGQMNLLTRFLFGSDLQKRMNQLQHTVTTPIDLFSGVASITRAGSRLARWEPISYTL